MCCCPLPSSRGRSPVNASATRSPPQRKRACGWAAMCRWAMTRASARSSSTLPRPRPCAVSSLSIVSSAACAGEQPRRPRPERPYTPADQASVEEIGTVKFYAADKGFGFIVRDRGGKDIFVHASALNRAGIAELGEGQRVAVDMIEGGKGPEALNIRLI